MFWLACKNVAHVPAFVNAIVLLASVLSPNAIDERLSLEPSSESVKTILSLFPIVATPKASIEPSLLI